MRFLKSIVVEAHRRSLWQVLGIYLVGAWIGYQVVNELTDGLGLPDWVPGLAFVLFIIGLPIVLATAFVQEGLPPVRREASLEDLERVADLTLRTDGFGADPDTAAARAPAKGRDHILFTWKRAVLGGITAFLLLGITASGYMGMRNAGIGPMASLVAKGDLEQRERVLISEFEGVGADAELAAMVTQAFRVDFSQSPVVTVVDGAYVRGVLTRMQRDPASTLDAELARDVAVRDGIKAIVTGGVHRTAAGYVLSASLVGVTEGTALASFRETAADSTEVLAAVDKLSKKLREKIGESLRSIRANQPLEAVTTPSFEALRKYTHASRALDIERDFDTSIALLLEAVAIDSTFGMAWRKLAVAYSNDAAGYERVAAAASRAYALRDRMTAYERDAAVAQYHMSVTRDWRAAITAYRSLLDLQPNDRTALNNIAINYHRVGEHEQAVTHYERALAVDSFAQSAYGNLASELLELGRAEDAERVLDVYEQRFGVTDFGLWRRFNLAGLRRDYGEALNVATRTAELRPGGPRVRSMALWMRVAVADVQGRLQDATRHEQEASAIERENGRAFWPGRPLLAEAERTLLLRRDPAAALRIADGALKAHPLDQAHPSERPYIRLIALYARAGRVDRARELEAERERTLPEEMRAGDRLSPRWAQFFIAAGDDRLEDALRVLRNLAPEMPCTLCVELPLAETFDLMGQRDSAIHHYERFIATPNQERIYEDFFLASVHERLADLYDERGDRAKTVEHAARFLELWAKADADLQPRVRARQDMLQRLTGEGSARR